MRGPASPSASAWSKTRGRGTFYRERHDGLIDLAWSTATAYYVNAAGTPILLEPPPGPQNRAELEAQQAEREPRDAAPKPRPAWMT